MAMPHLWLTPDHQVQLKARPQEESPPPRRRRAPRVQTPEPQGETINQLYTRLQREIAFEHNPKKRKRRTKVKKTAPSKLKKVEVVKALTRYDRLMAEDD